jgi:hypothetical protein
MSTREELLGLLRELIEREGPGVTLRQFERETGISVGQVYRRWGDWKSLSRAAGQPERGRPGTVHTDGVLLAELNRVSAAYGEFPTKAAFDRLSSFCWGTIERRFGKRPAGWEAVKAKKGEEAPGGSTGAKRRTLELGAEEALTPEEWNAFYNHLLAVPILDIGAGLFPEMLRDRDPRDPRPNPPPWERDLES